jgi:hypothetical protein
VGAMPVGSLGVLVVATARSLSAYTYTMSVSLKLPLTWGNGASSFQPTPTPYTPCPPRKRPLGSGGERSLTPCSRPRLLRVARCAPRAAILIVPAYASAKAAGSRWPSPRANLPRQEVLKPHYKRNVTLTIEIPIVPIPTKVD